MPRIKRKRIVMFPWKMASSSGKALSGALGIRRIYHDGKYQPRAGDTIINWGNTQKGTWWGALEAKGAKVLNHPDVVTTASNKILALKAMDEAGVSIPDFTEDMEEAKSWFNDGKVVVARTIVSGHQAKGVHMLAKEGDTEFVRAPLYTMYIKKSKEFRVHVVGGRVIDVAQKRLSHNKPRDSVDYRIRNYGGGWIYARTDIEVPDDVKTQAVAAVQSLNLDFGAVDVGWNEHYKRAVVYEVNSAPGLTGTTLYRYAKAFSVALRHHLVMQEPEDQDDHIGHFDAAEFQDPENDLGTILKQHRDRIGAFNITNY